MTKTDWLKRAKDALQKQRQKYEKIERNDWTDTACALCTGMINDCTLCPNKLFFDMCAVEYWEDCLKQPNKMYMNGLIAAERDKIFLQWRLKSITWMLANLEQAWKPKYLIKFRHSVLKEHQKMLKEAKKGENKK